MLLVAAAVCARRLARGATCRDRKFQRVGIAVGRRRPILCDVDRRRDQIGQHLESDVVWGLRLLSAIGVDLSLSLVLHLTSPALVRRYLCYSTIAPLLHTSILGLLRVRFQRCHSIPRLAILRGRGKRSSPSSDANLYKQLSEMGGQAEQVGAPARTCVPNELMYDVGGGNRPRTVLYRTIHPVRHFCAR